MSKYTIFHNPRCSKSRQTLQILKDNECDTEIILYLETTIDQSVLVDVIKKISLSPRELLRKGEQEFKDNDLKNKNLSDQEIIEFMVKHPKLIERPIVIKGNKNANEKVKDAIEYLIGRFRSDKKIDRNDIITSLNKEMIEETNNQSTVQSLGEVIKTPKS